MTSEGVVRVLTRRFLAWGLEGSTKAWEARPGDARLAVSRSVDAARRAVGEHGGRLFKLVGDGGWAEFESAASGLQAAIDLQRAMGGAALGARTALYSGEAERG